MVRPDATLKATKWVGLAAAIWVQASGGNAYTFAFYSPTLKSILHYNQLQLNNLGVAKDFGENVGLLAGYLCNKLPAWAILSVGALFGFLGYGTVWLAVSQRIAPLAYWQMCALLCLGGNSATWFNTAVLVTCMRNFPRSRGTVVGILKGFVGLSAAIFTQVFTALLDNNAVWLLVFLAIGPTVVCLAAMLFIRPVPEAGDVQDPDERSNFHYIMAVCIVLAVYLFASTLIEDLVVLNPLIPIVFTAVMVVFLAAPLAVPIKVLSSECYGVGPMEEEKSGIQEALLKVAGIDEYQSSNPPLLIKGEQETEPQRETENKVAEDIATSIRPEPSDSVLDVEGKDVAGKKLHEELVRRLTQEEDAETLLAVGEGAVKRRKGRPRRGEDFKLRQALVKADFWLLFFTFFCGVGTGVAAINNLGQIGEAQGYYNVNIFVSLISIANFLGRLGGGGLSEHYLRTDAIPRTVWMGIAQFFMIFVHLLFASALPGSLYAGSVLLGLCYGVHFSIMVPTASELFGLKHFGMIYNFLTIANPLGSLLFSGLIAGYLYDKEAAKDPSSGLTGLFNPQILAWQTSLGVGTTQVCSGAHCFRLTFYIMACVCAVGVVLTSVLTFRIRRVYLSLYGKSPRASASDLRSLEGKS